MYKTTLHDTPIITVSSRGDSVSYSINNTKMNPLEAFYASLAGCAGVYAKKACMSLGVSAEGIEINCIPKSGSSGLLSLSKFTTQIRFPEHFTEDQKSTIIDNVSHCAVKEVVLKGHEVDFNVEEV